MIKCARPYLRSRRGPPRAHTLGRCSWGCCHRSGDATRPDDATLPRDTRQPPLRLARTCHATPPSYLSPRVSHTIRMPAGPAAPAHRSETRTVVTESELRARRATTNQRLLWLLRSSQVRGKVPISPLDSRRRRSGFVWDFQWNSTGFRDENINEGTQGLITLCHFLLSFILDR